MEYEVIVPDWIRNDIQETLHLSVDGEARLYELLETGLAYGHEKTCFRLAAPTPTYIYKVELSDQGTDYLFTFWLTYGPRDDALYVMQWATETPNWDDWNPDLG